ncbi:hypothetical protein K4L44_16045 [Halosquirtibacter laminarini]|uniref:Uncharacterized protein n=1 Tax=Halosquirtibacter laminarini TaxID=3374600 RepID=A0AC61NES8_9BACT|nr:hypothetical protein K4L44_16045 [Prolixibacteraceae bacterium]
MKWFKNGSKLYLAALKYINGGNEKKALEYLYASSEKRYIDAICALAFHQLHRFKVPLWNEFISKDIVEKAIFIAEEYRIKQNMAKADRWFRFAAKRGDKMAISRLGDAYREQNMLEEAVDCYKECINTGDAYSAWRVAEIADSHPYSVHHIAIETKVDLYFMAAKAGIKEAFLPVGVFFDEGITVEVSRDLAVQWYEKAADFSSIAQYRLGKILVKDSPRKSSYWFRQAAKLGNVDAAIVMAKQHISLGELDIAKSFLSPVLEDLDGDSLYLYTTLLKDGDKKIETLKLATSKSSKDASFELYLYFKSKCILEEAYRYLDLASELHHPDAIKHIGDRYAGDRSWVTAFKYYSKAALRSNKIALRKISQYYWMGRGVEQDRAQALMYLRRASKEGDMLSKYFLALANLYGKGVVKNRSKAISLLSEVEGKLYGVSQYQLGVIFLNESPNSAKKRFLNALHSGLQKASWFLAYGHEMDLWDQSNMDYAVTYYQEAIRCGIHESYNNIGVIYHYGKSGIVDLDRATSFYQKAIAYHVTESFYNYSVLLLECGDKLKDREAVSYLEKATNLGSMEALMLLSKIHIHNIVADSDYSRGMELLNTACSKGLEEAKELMLSLPQK